MKHCIVDKQSQLILFKVADELVEEFEIGHKDQVIAFGNSIMEALLEFERVDDPKEEGEIGGGSVKY
ncbi:hypothetical protein [Agriterribacter sp.]|uniref:hypothetical protein n=1 Tax=Agriterribacter sp. TaxID=2821509 RepID=UPI002C5FD16D|nr:hypothetical protein [Agriterribacter sp.]HTN06454.1 hypothetical protein [Agriterribacter sp.]